MNNLIIISHLCECKNLVFIGIIGFLPVPERPFTRLFHRGIVMLDKLNYQICIKTKIPS
jgi:hypothetical protein